MHPATLRPDAVERITLRWRRLSSATRLLIVLDSLAFLLIAILLVFASNVIVSRVSASVDADLGHHVRMVQSVLLWESRYLAAEAQTVVNLVGVDEALQARDAGRLGRLLSTVQVTHNLDAIFVISARGKVLEALGESLPAPESILSLEVVQRGLAGENRNRIFVAGSKLWLAGVAPHVDASGRVDAIFLLLRQIDRDYLVKIRQNMGPDVVLAAGDFVVSSLSSSQQDRLVAGGYLPGAEHEAVHGPETVTLDGTTYRMIVSDLDSLAAPGIVMGLLQSNEMVQGIIWPTIGQIAVVGIVLIGVTFALFHFLVRGIFRPLEILGKAAENMASGNLASPVEVHGIEEVENLASSLDHMRRRLQELVSAQESWGRELETKVRSRTSELTQLCSQRDRLLAQLISAQEEERRRIARELHDETSQNLASLIISLGTVASSTTDERTRALLNDMKSLATKALEGIKRNILDLRPRLLDEYGLQAAVQWLAEEHLSQAGIQTQVDFQGAERRLPVHVETNLFRIVQEAVNNIARHSRATCAWIRMVWEPTAITITVEDNGRGFDVAEGHRDPKQAEGLGLLSMRERAELVGGTLTIESVPGQGTTVSVRVVKLQEVGTG